MATFAANFRSFRKFYPIGRQQLRNRSYSHNLCCAVSTTIQSASCPIFNTFQVSHIHTASTSLSEETGKHEGKPGEEVTFSSVSGAQSDETAGDLNEEAEQAEQSDEDAELGGSESEFEGDEAIEEIYQAALEYVYDHGWSREAIAAGAEEVGLPSVAHGLFPGGAVDLITMFYQRCNEEMAERLAEQVAAMEPGELKIRTFVVEAMKMRLQMLEPYIDNWAEAMGIMALPQNALKGWSNLGDLADEIWYQTGDTSTDFNWYTKRLSVGAIYKASEIFMLQDESEDFEETWQFLENRVADLFSVTAVTKEMSKLPTAVAEGAYTASVLGKNALGLNQQ